MSSAVARYGVMQPQNNDDVSLTGSDALHIGGQAITVRDIRIDVCNPRDR